MTTPEMTPTSKALEYAHDVRWPNDRIDLARLCDAFAKRERERLLAMLHEHELHRPSFCDKHEDGCVAAIATALAEADPSAGTDEGNHG